MSQINIKLLLLIPLVFLFLPSMYIIGVEVPVYDIIIGIAFVLLMLSNKSIGSFKQVILSLKYKFMKFLVLYIGWVIISGIFLVILGYYNILYALYAIFILFIYNDILWFVYPSLLFPKYFSLKTCIKVLLIAIYIICIYGIFVYVFDSIGIHIFRPLQQIIVSRRLVAVESIRVRSVFEEPGYFGGFLCVNLPIIFSTILSKYAILRNKFLNIFFKKTYIPLVFLTIILIQSPIWFVFSIITTMIYFFKKIFIVNIKRTLYIGITGLLCVLIIIICLNTISIENTFFNRITKTTNSLNSLEVLVYKEPSLANRIIHYTVRLKIFFAHPIAGIGYKNTEYHAKNIFNKLNMPLTQETISSLSSTKEKMVVNGAILWDTLADTGLVGLILYYSFLFSLIKTCKKLIHNLPIGLEKSFIYGVRKTYIAIICFSFYDIRPNFIYYWFLYGLTLCFIAYCKKLKNQVVIKEIAEFN